MIKVDGTINGGTISNNKTIVNDGGGIRTDGKLTVNSVNIINNSSNRNGGGIDWTYGAIFWNGGKLEENSAKGEGKNLNPEFSDESNNWVNFERLNITPIDVSLEKKYNKKTDISDISLQGMTATDKYLVFAQMKAENENTKINIVDKNTYKILNTIDDYCFGHANNITYNSKDGKCYMSYTKDNKSYVTSFKINDNKQLEDVNTKELDRAYFALTYDEDDNCFIGISGDEVFIIDENFGNIIRKFKYSEKDLTKQDIMYYKGHIYFACWEAGEKTNYQTNFYNREKNSNVIYVYNMDGTLQKTLYISNKKAFGEIEGAAVDSNGKLILGYNTESWTSISFYSSNYLNGVDSIKISSSPLKNKYIQNYEKLDLTGGELTVNYNNGTSDKISLTNENIKVTGFDNSKIGKNIVEIEYAGKKDSFEVEIIEKQVENIRLKARPIKTTYIQNYENLDLTGGELEIIYNDNSTDSISLTNSNIQIEGFDNKKIGNNEITVNYVGHQIKFNVEIISKQIVDMEVIAKPTKMKYVINEENLDLTGGIIAVKYNDESVDKIAMTNECVQTIGFDNTKLGKNKITVQYEGKSVEYEIEIINKINTIEEDLNNNNNHNSNNNQSENLKENVDDTIARTELPKAGKAKVIVTFIISLCLFLIFLSKKLRKYNDIKE